MRTKTTTSGGGSGLVGPLALVASDAMGLALASLIALVVLHFLSPHLTGEAVSPYAKLVADRWVSLLPACGAFFFGCLSRSHYFGRPQFWDEARGVAASAVAALLVEGTIQYAMHQEGSRLWTLAGWAGVPLAVVAARTIGKILLLRAGLRGLSVVVVGRQYEGSCAADALVSDRLMGYQVVGIHDGEGGVDAVLESSGATHVVVALSEDGDGRYAAFARELGRRGISFSVAVPPTGMASTMTRSSGVFGHDVMFLEERKGLALPLARAAKRASDVAMAASALAVVSPLAIVVAILLLREGHGVFFGHERVGAGGRRFRCLKFTSMHKDSASILEHLLATDDDARREWDSNRKLTDDPRVTRLGRLLRRTAIDEIPQFVNVLAGHMSIVGPRPVTCSELDVYYGDERRSYELVRPGLTGLWQASGRNDVGYERRVAMDAWYVRNWSMWLDCVLILKTIPVLISRKGAS